MPEHEDEPMPDMHPYPYGHGIGDYHVLEAIGNQGAHLQNAERVNAAQNANAHRDLASDVRDTSHATNRDLASGQRDILGELCGTRRDIYADGGQTRDRLAMESRFLGETVNDHRRETTKDHCDIQGNIKDSLSTLRRDICEVDHNVSKEACQTREVVKEEAKDILMGQATIRKEMVEQHCDIKLLLKDQNTLIVSENQRTRDLLNETENQRLRDKLAQANAIILGGNDTPVVLS